MIKKQDKAKLIILLERLKLIESEIFRLSSKYGIKTVEELDHLLEKGKISEKEVGDDLFLFDHLLEEKEKLEKELKNYSISKKSVWENLQNLLGLPRLSFKV